MRGAHALESQFVGQEQPEQVRWGVRQGPNFSVDGKRVTENLQKSSGVTPRWSPRLMFSVVPTLLAFLGCSGLGLR